MANKVPCLQANIHAGYRAVNLVIKGSEMQMKKLMLTGALLLPLLVCAEEGAEGSDDGIQTDRPDFVESSNTVGNGRYQLETSVAYERDKNADERTRTFSTPTLIRLGFADDWEVRVESDAWMHQRTQDRATRDNESETGWADYSLGLKWHQTDGDGKASPSIGWLAHLDMPGGTDSFMSKKVRPSLRMVAEWELANDYSLGVMPGLIYDVNADDDRFVGGILGVVLGKSFTDKFRGFLEFGGQEIMRKKDGGSQITLDVGVAYLLSKDIQLDAVYNAGLNRYTPDHTFGTGLSMKF
jgi:hypothetical protein